MEQTRIGQRVTYKGDEYTIVGGSFSDYDGTILDIRKKGDASGHVSVVLSDLGFIERLKNPEPKHTWG